MVLYVCPRCRYETRLKGDIRRHFNKKKKCKTLFSRKSVKDCLADLDSLVEDKVVISREEYDRSNIAKENLKITTCDKDRMGICHPQEEENGITDHFIYLIQEREFIKTQENVYKLGKTVNPKQRLSSYPKGSKVILIIPCSDCDVAESSLLSLFDRFFTKRKDIGVEYYEGDIGSMAKMVMRYILNEGGESLAFPPGELIDE